MLGERLKRIRVCLRKDFFALRPRNFRMLQTKLDLIPLKEDNLLALCFKAELLLLQYAVLDSLLPGLFFFVENHFRLLSLGKDILL